MANSASSSEEALRDRISKGGFAMALSGGGHRATLATLGALMAIIDRGLGSKLIQVASVSGGTITNAFVAQRVQLETLGPGGLDEIARELATTVIRKGVLTEFWIALLALGPILVGTAIGIAIRIVLIPWTWLALLIAIAVMLTTLLGRGSIVEWLLDRRYFRKNADGGASKVKEERARISSLSGRDVDHVFCTTDLVLGLPVYISSQGGGIIWRRLEPERDQVRGYGFQTFSADRLSIAAAVRASAAFPGIPPRRLRVPNDPQIELVGNLPKAAFLADGGLWNNLSTHVIREDGFTGIGAVWERGVLRPRQLPPGIPILCFNGSASLRPFRPSFLEIPGLALLGSLFQVTQILNANTVLPRVEAMRHAFERRAYRGERPDSLDPADLLVDLRPTRKMAYEYLPGTWSQELIRKSDRVVKEWERNQASSVRFAREHVDANKHVDWLKMLLGPPDEPVGSYPVCGLADIEDWDRLRDSAIWKQLVETEGEELLEAPTTLGRIETALARRLIARGYLNTYLASLFLAPLDKDEIPRLADLPKRLDRIAAA